MFGVSVTTHEIGPMFDGRAAAALDAGVHHVEREMTDELVAKVREHLVGVLRHNTGRYISTIHTEGGNEVHDGTRYGPWLEGVGSRNFTTRFKGYHTFKVVASDYNMRARERADRLLQPYIEEMR